MSLLPLLLLAPFPLGAQSPEAQAGPKAGIVQPLAVFPKDRLAGPVGGGAWVRLRGSVHPLARPASDAGPVEAALPMRRMSLVLQRDEEQQAALDAYSVALQDPQSPYYHQWLTPEAFGLHFGVSAGDLERVAGWLRSQGFTIDEIPPAHWTIVFSGTAAQVEAAFQTELRYYRIGDALQYSNPTDPQIPESLAGMVSGVVGLSNIRLPRKDPVAQPQLVTSKGDHWMEPSDFATIYDLNPLYANGIEGNGVNIAVVEPCTMDVSLASTFWALEGISAQHSNWYWQYGGGTPAQCSGGAIDETYLDYEWAGAVAHRSKIWLVTSSANDALFDAIQGVTNDTTLNAAIISLSYSDCASVSYNRTLVTLWQQAHTAGITGVISSGDAGPAGCDAHDATTATGGAVANGFCESPYAVCVGGTQFNDTANPSAYWSSAGKALGYIPEVAWNESGTVTGGSGLWSSGGGYSTFVTKPAWQTGNTSQYRGVPDVSLAAAAHTPYRVCVTTVSQCSNSGSIWGSNGTSASAPSFAAMLALVVGQNGFQGSVNQTLYSLASRTDIHVFHDITSGNNNVPGQLGFNAGPGWDAVTGLGSVDAAVMVNNWQSTAPPVTQYTLTVVNGSGSGSYAAGTVVSISANAPPSGQAFLNWTGATVANPNASSTTLTMPAANTTVTANYTALSRYTLTVVNGSGSGSYTAGTVVSISANAAPSGQAFLNWTGATVANPNAASTTLTMPAANTTVTANYYTIAAPPSIASVSTILPQASQTIIITGSGFGTLNPYTGDSSYIQIVDLTQNGWSAGYSGGGSPNLVTLSVTSWTNSQIVIGGFTGAYGQNGWVLKAGDQIQVRVWNPQTNLSGTYTCAVQSSGPVIQSVVVSYAGSDISQNTWVEIRGTSLVPSNTPANGQIWSSAPSFAQNQMPTQIGGVSATVNGKSAYIYFYCSSATDSQCALDQINVLTPLDNTLGPVNVVVTNNGLSSAPFASNLKTVTPSFFQWFGKYAVATHANATYVGPTTLFPGASSPALAGEAITLWMTGFGLPVTTLTPGSSIQSGQLPANPVISFNGTPAAISYAGVVSPGLYQINLTVPSNAPTGDVGVSASYQGANAPSGNFINVLNQSAKPALLVSSSFVGFSYLVGGSYPSTSISVSSGTPGASISYSASASTTSGGNWLSVSPASGTTPGSLTISTNPAGLASGSYTGSVILTSAGASNSPVTVQVSINVLGSAVASLQVSSTYVSTSYGGGSNPAVSISVTSSSGTALSYSASTSTSWLSVTPSSGTTPGSILITMNAASLGSGYYTGYVTLTAPNASNSPVSIQVNLAVSVSSPSLQVSSSYVGTSYGGGPNPTASISVTSSNPSTALSYSASAGSSWLSVSPSSGTTPGSILITMNAASLGSGTYTGYVTLTAPAASNSPVSIQVSLIVSGSSPSLQVSSSYVGTSYGGGPNPTASISVTSSNPSTALSYSASTSTSWLSVSPSSGTTPGSILITMNAASLGSGYYTGYVTLTAPNASNSPVSIQVSLTVSGSSPSLQVSSSYVGTSYGGGPNPTASISVTSSNPSTALSYSASAGSSWLSVSPSSGTTPGSILITMNASSLGSGSYTGYVTLTAPAASNSPVSIQVNVIVSGSPVYLQVSSTYIGVSFTSGNYQTATVQVTSSNPGVALNYTASASTTNGGNWLSVTPSSGTTPGSLLVTMNMAGLPGGGYSGQVVLTAPGASNSPVTIQVYFLASYVGMRAGSPHGYSPPGTPDAGSSRLPAGTGESGGLAAAGAGRLPDPYGAADPAWLEARERHPGCPSSPG